MKGRDQQRGFTLIETLAAIVILSATLITAYVAMSNALATARRVKDRSDVVTEVERAVGALEAHGVLLSPDIEGETSQYRWHVSVKPLPAGAVGTASPAMPYRVIGRIARKSDGFSAVVIDTIMLRPGR